MSHPPSTVAPALFDRLKPKASIMSITDPSPAADPVPHADPDQPDSGRSELPSQAELRWSVVRALREHGEMSVNELADLIADEMGLSEALRAETIPTGARKLPHRIAWVAFRLKEVGLLHYPRRTVRALTDRGKDPAVGEQEVEELWDEYQPRTASSTRDDQEVLIPDEPCAAWLIRAGGSGELADSFIQEGLVAVGFGGLGDLSMAESREELIEWIKDDEPEASDQRVQNRASQLWKLRSDVGEADLIVMPQKDSHAFALGTVTRRYWYRADLDDKRHTVSVQWKSTDVPRTNLEDDLRKSLSRRSTVNKLSSDDALRLQELMETGQDPGPRAGSPETEMDSVDLEETLTETAEKLLVDVKLLDDIVELLEDKRQVILYGPPGTGKTYLARELAKALAPQESCRELVQFHPSTSYEDFFEGYRPVGSSKGDGIAYKLTPGPLARIAKRARKNPKQRHVMIIDEINRGNLPRVLGELLFLLEYRDESMTTLYRPDKPFSLPENLMFIGTMNTADRSIALVDAALRRRFHFVPFYPDEGPVADLLDRWLQHKKEPEWIGELVKAVNAELKKELEGSHLLLGPSHFMKKYGASREAQKEQLRRIWKYNIEPFIEDQFFGDPAKIKTFGFDAVMKRHAPSLIGSSSNPDDDSSESTATPPESTVNRALVSSEELNEDISSRWRQQAADWPPREQEMSASYRTEQKSVICRWVEFCLDRNKNPKDSQELVEAFLQSLSIADSSAYSYRDHLKRWFNYDHRTKT